MSDYHLYTVAVLLEHRGDHHLKFITYYKGRDGLTLEVAKGQALVEAMDKYPGCAAVQAVGMEIAPEHILIAASHIEPQERTKELADIIKQLTEVMEIQEQRAKEAFDLSAEAFMPIWNDAKAKGKELLKKYGWLKEDKK